MRSAFVHAAIAYFIYGVTYMTGAIAELDDSRRRDFFGDNVPWWVFYVAGGVFLVVMPFLIARGSRWLAGGLAFFTAAKALYLFYSLGRGFDPFTVFFALVAMAATVFLARAAAKRVDGGEVSAQT